MKKAEIEVGKVYIMKVSGKLVPVRISSVCIYGGWNGVNTITKREVRIKSAAKLRREAEPKTKAPSELPFPFIRKIKHLEAYFERFWRKVFTDDPGLPQYRAKAIAAALLQNLFDKEFGELLDQINGDSIEEYERCQPAYGIYLEFQEIYPDYAEVQSNLIKWSGTTTLFEDQQLYREHRYAETIR